MTMTFRAVCAFLLVLGIVVFATPSISSNDLPRKVAALSQATVRIVALIPQGQPPFDENTRLEPAFGSGVVLRVVDRDSCEVEVLTAKHVIGDDPRYQTVFVGEGVANLPDPITRHPGLDLALLRATVFPCNDFRDVKIGGEPQDGEPVYLIGFPGDKHYQVVEHDHNPVYTSYFSFFNLEWIGGYFLWGDGATIAPGFSGGPVVDRRGRLLGIVVGGLFLDNEDKPVPIFLGVDEQVIDEMRGKGK